MTGLELWLVCAAGVAIWVGLVWRYVLRGADLPDHHEPADEPGPLLELVPARLCACGCGLPTRDPGDAYRFGHYSKAHGRARPELVASWRARAERLEAYARDCREEGVVLGAYGAEDAEAAALEYRLAADEVEAELEARAGEAAS